MASSLAHGRLTKEGYHGGTIHEARPADLITGHAVHQFDSLAAPQAEQQLDGRPIQEGRGIGGAQLSENVGNSFQPRGLIGHKRSSRPAYPIVCDAAQMCGIDISERLISLIIILIWTRAPWSWG